jgi:hypothetical protein
MNPILVNNLLWVTQGFLALTFLIAGSAKLFGSPASVAQLVPAAFPLSLLRTLGALELLAAAGIILPFALNMLPGLTRLTAGCMGIVLLGAMVVHLKEKQFSRLPMLLLLLALAVLIIIGR